MGEEHYKCPRCQIKAVLYGYCAVCGWEDDEYHKGVSIEEEEEKLDYNSVS